MYRYMAGVIADDILTALPVTREALNLAHSGGALLHDRLVGTELMLFGWSPSQLERKCYRTCIKRILRDWESV
jgi:hypothetical protein